jgi:hypothetical protein
MAFSMNGADQRKADLFLRPQSPQENDVSLSLSGRTRVDPSSITGNVGHILFIGQSTNHNSVNEPIVPSHGSNIFNLSIAHRGAVFSGGTQPLFSGNTAYAGDAGGHHGVALADQFIDDDTFDNMLITMIATGGSYCADWCPGGGTAGGGGGARTGVLAYRIGLAARCIFNAGLSHIPLIIDWQQGEVDSDNTVTSQANYEAALNGVVTEFKKVGLLKSGNVMFINKCTRLSNSSGNKNTIRAAQAAVPDGDLVRVGADIDTLTGGTNRYDGVHFTLTGAIAQAALKKSVIDSWLAG